MSCHVGTDLQIANSHVFQNSFQACFLISWRNIKRKEKPTCLYILLAFMSPSLPLVIFYAFSKRHYVCSYVLTRYNSVENKRVFVVAAG